jgi:cell division protein FtsW (lipid II flippase)
LSDLALQDMALRDLERFDRQASAGLSVALTLVVAALTALGVVLVYSSTSVGIALQHSDATLYLRKQLLWVALGTGVFVLARTTDLDSLRRWSPWIIGGTVLLS